ncbi:MAG: hypothetical protein ACYDAN_13380 [Candidatus Limnocylindrales bacterium]
MTQPENDPAELEQGTDVTAGPLDGSADTPASSDPDEMTDDGEMGGTGGKNAGGAG